ncbi:MULTISPECIES: hypothetical protein [Gordonibacter]|uniref:Uncharacterized protein n=1 Tax=Gordonibacter faecis TaxID=3047475 RepID=A0ABT7DQ30_9ACTN|nr:MULTISPECIES: hypothetical protein [unclassified Gordonibacter]MDJ1651643.1 hypothetical protein [Gordonibacter sp. KGMB12511]HIW77066.1 hypothetical protein [Candidatus Gordonibacter avicola]
MSEKKYLLTHDEICQLQDISLSTQAWEDDGNDEMVKQRQEEYRAMLEAHEYKERTCLMIKRRECEQLWNDSTAYDCSVCGHLNLDPIVGGYCRYCRAKVV